MRTLLRPALGVALLISGGCGYARQYTSPELRTLVREYRAGTVPNRDREIFFQDRPLDDDDFARMFPVLKGYGRVDVLNFQGHPGLTDASVPLLVRFKSLRRLDLIGTGVSVNGMKGLSAIPELHTLVIDAFGYSADEIAALRAALPKIQVRLDSLYEREEPAAVVSPAAQDLTAPSAAPARPYSSRSWRC